MKVILVFFSLLSFLASCQTKQGTDKSIRTQNSEKINYPFSEIDSLNKYLGADSMFQSETKMFYVGSANNRDFGLVTLTDSSFVFYQLLNSRWIVTDTIKSDAIVEVEAEDLNGDKYKDLIITLNITAAGANSENVVCLFDTIAGKFVRNGWYDLPNIKYDRKKKIIESAWWAGAAHCQSKMTYKISGDSLIFNAGMDYCPEERTQGETAVVEIYKMIRGERIITKKITGRAERLSNIFEKTFWDSSDDPQ